MELPCFSTSQLWGNMQPFFYLPNLLSVHYRKVLSLCVTNPWLIYLVHAIYLGFTDSSAGKESACNSGDPGLIPGLGRSTGEAIGYPLQYSWASLVAQLVKKPPATWETWDRSLGWEDPLEKGKAAHSSILTWRMPWTVQSMGSQRVRHNWTTFTFMLSTYHHFPAPFNSNLTGPLGYIEYNLWPT